MKTKSVLLISAIALVAFGTKADSLSTGRAYMAQTNYVAASQEFSKAVAASPKDPTANTLWAISRVLAFPSQSAGSNFLTRMGIAKSGRVLGDWKASFTLDKHDNPVFASGLNFKEAGQLLRSSFLPVLAAAGTNLAAVTDPDFSLSLTAQETRSVAVTIDYGDILLARAMAHAAECFCYMISAWNAEVPVANIQTLAKNNQLSIQKLLSTYPKALTYASTADLPAARASFISGVNNYVAASEFIRNRPTNVTRLFNWDSGMTNDEQKFRLTLVDLTNSFSTPTPLSIDTNRIISLAPLFDGYHPLRSFLPTFTNNAFIYGSLVDPTFGGIVSGVSLEQANKALLKKLKAELIQPGVKLSELYPFTNVWPQAFVTLGSDGNLYGVLPNAGTYGMGEIFRSTPSGNLTPLYNFNSGTGAYYYNFIGSPTQAADKSFYGIMRYYSQTTGQSVCAVYQFTAGGGFSQLATFQSSFIIDYGEPQTPLVLSPGKDCFYGASVRGIYKLAFNGAITPLISSGPTDLLNVNPLVFGVDGDIYGTFGTFGSANVFRVSTGGSLVWIKQLDLSAAEYGYGFCEGPLAQAADGTFYVTVSDGTKLYIFQVATSGASSLFATLDKSQGAGIGQGLVVGSDQNLYGVAANGGGSDNGSIFQIIPGSGVNPLVWFDGDSGSNPSSIISAGNGVFYGITQNGGSKSGGNLFRMTVATVGVSITSAPQSVTNALGGTLRLSVSASGTAPISYQWYCNNQALTGQTASTLSIGNLRASQAGTYKVVVSNTAGSASASCQVVVLAPPTVTPASPEVVAITGSNAVLSATVSGTAPFKYQWYFNGAAISKATTSSLTLAKITPAQAGTYTLTASNSIGADNASILVQVVPPAPIIATAAGRYYTNPIIKGTAVASVTKITYRLNNGATQTASGTTNWNIVNLTLVPGTNTLAVQAVSGSLTSPSATRSYVFVATTKLALSVVGSGALKPAWTNGQTLEIGTTASVSATPAKGWLFSNWAGTAASASTNIQFLVASNPTLTVTFVKNPFSTLKGTYTGLLLSSNSNKAGAITLTLTTNATFSYQLTMDGATYGSSGQLDPDGNANTILLRKGFAPLTNVWRLDPDSKLISGSTTEGTWTANVTANLNDFSKSNPATNVAGSYTFATFNPTNAAEGHGCGTLTIDTLGIAKLTGFLPDDTSIPANTLSVSSSGLIAVYIPLFNGKGFAAGWVSVEGKTWVDGSLLWVCPPNATAKTLWKSGFTNNIEFSGSVYRLTNGVPVISGSSLPVILSGGNLPDSITNTLSINSKNVLTVNPPVDAKLSLALNPTTGVVSGIFTHPATQKTVKVHAILLQQPGIGYGYFLGTNAAGSLSITQ